MLEVCANPFESIGPWLDVVHTASGEGLTSAERTRRARLLERDRLFAAMQGSQMIGGLAVLSFDLAVPGGQVRAAAVTTVAVLPTHRRRGVLTTLIRRQFEDSRERSEPVAILTTSEGGIYQHFGFGLGSLHASIAIQRDRSAFREAHRAEGQVQFLERSQALAHFRPVYEQLRRERAGVYGRSDERWDADILTDREPQPAGAGPTFYAAYEVDGANEGYAIFRQFPSWERGIPTGSLGIDELVAVTPRAVRDLWRLVLDMDLVQTIEADFQPIDHPLLSLLAEPRRLRLQTSDGLWVRLIDVTAALEDRSYAADGELVLGVADRFCGWNDRRICMEVQDGHARVTVSSRAPDLELDVADLGALYLGAFSPSDLARVGRVVPSRRETLELADAIFASARPPWCPRTF